MNKRGSYFFVLDVFIASAILILTLVIILSSRVNTPEPEQAYLLAENYMNFLTTTEFRDTALTHKKLLLNQSLVPDTRMTLDQVIAYLYYTGARNNSVPPNWTKLVIEDISGIIPPQYGFQYEINDNVTFVRMFEGKPSTDFLNYSRLVMGSKRITFFKVNKTVLIGPWISEVKIWS